MNSGKRILCILLIAAWLPALMGLAIAGTLTIDYKNHGPEIVQAFCDTYNYNETVPDPTAIDDMQPWIPNPESKVQFTRRMVQEYIKNIVKAHRATRAADMARKGEEAVVDSDYGDITNK